MKKMRFLVNVPRGAIAAREQYVTGDGRKFATREAAIEHANKVHKKTGVIIAVEKKNPPRGARRARKTTARHTRSNRVAAAVPRRKRRPPPAGFASWSAYMASIRPGAKRATAKKSRGSSMAKSKKRRRSHARHRRSSSSSTAVVRHRSRGVRRYRHNPPGLRSITRGIIPFATTTAVRSAEALAGEVTVRKVRGLTGQAAGSIVGSAIEAVVAIVGGSLLRTVNVQAGEMFAVGGVMAPMRTLVQRAGIPHVSDSLADDAFTFGGDTGVTMVSAYDDPAALGDQSGLSEFVPGQGTLSEFVQGAAAA